MSTPPKVIEPDYNFDSTGAPKWFEFIIKDGGSLVRGPNGDMEYVGGKSEVFDWPLPQMLRIKCYAKLAARDLIEGLDD